MGLGSGAEGPSDLSPPVLGTTPPSSQRAHGGHPWGQQAAQPHSFPFPPLLGGGYPLPKGGEAQASTRGGG